MVTLTPDDGHTGLACRYKSERKTELVSICRVNGRIFNALYLFSLTIAPTLSNGLPFQLLSGRERGAKGSPLLS